MRRSSMPRTPAGRLLTAGRRRRRSAGAHRRGRPGAGSRRERPLSPSAAPSPRPIRRRARTGRPRGRTRPAAGVQVARSASTQSMRPAMSGPMASADDRAYARAVAAKSTAVTCHPRAADQSASDPWPRPRRERVRGAVADLGGQMAVRAPLREAIPVLAQGLRPALFRVSDSGREAGSGRPAPNRLPASLQWTRPALPRRPKAFPHQLLRAQSSVKVSRRASPLTNRSPARYSCDLV